MHSEVLAQMNIFAYFSFQVYHHSHCFQRIQAPRAWTFQCRPMFLAVQVKAFSMDIDLWESGPKKALRYMVKSAYAQSCGLWAEDIPEYAEEGFCVRGTPAEPSRKHD